MEPFGYKEPPYDEMASALVLTEAVRRIVTVYKDQNERGLARPMAQIMARYLPPRWMGAARPPPGAGAASTTPSIWPASCRSSPGWTSPLCSWPPAAATSGSWDGRGASGT